MMSTENIPSETTPEWSYNIEVDQISSDVMRVSITADEKEKSDLASRLGVESVQKAEAEFHIRRETTGHIIHIHGFLKGIVTQSCVVTLEPVESHILEEFEAWYAEKEAVISLNQVKKDRALQKGNVEIEMSEEHEDPEPIVNGKIDLGELATQYFCLAINPYPHVSGEEGYEYRETPEEDAGKEGLDKEKKNPFSILKKFTD